MYFSLPQLFMFLFDVLSVAVFVIRERSVKKRADLCLNLDPWVTEYYLPSLSHSVSVCLSLCARARVSLFLCFVVGYVLQFGEIAHKRVGKTIIIFIRKVAFLFTLLFSFLPGVHPTHFLCSQHLWDTVLGSQTNCPEVTLCRDRTVKSTNQPTNPKPTVLRWPCAVTGRWNPLTNQPTPNQLSWGDPVRWQDGEIH